MGSISPSVLVSLLEGAETLERSIEHGLSTMRSRVQFLERIASNLFRTLTSHQPERDRALWYWLKALPETEMARHAGKAKRTIIADALRPFEDHFTDHTSSENSHSTNPYPSDALPVGHGHPYLRHSRSMPIGSGYGSDNTVVVRRDRDEDEELRDMLYRYSLH